MSIKVMTRVWEHSTQNNGKLLLLLALADHADDNGVCWPSIGRLAQKARIEPRQAKRHLRALEKEGELFTLPQKGMPGGRGYTNLYFVTVALETDEIARVLTERFDMSPEEAKKTAEQIKDGKSDTHKKGVIQGQKGVIEGQKGVIQGQKRVSSTPPESSYNHQGTVKDPSTRAENFLPDAETQLDVLFPENGHGIQDQLRSMQRVSWKPGTDEVRQALAHFLKASNLPIPNSKQTRKDWESSIRLHLENFGLNVLEKAYPVAIERTKHLTIGRPGGLDTTLSVIVRDLQTAPQAVPADFEVLTPRFLEEDI